MVTVSLPSVEQRVTLRNISWQTYETLLAETGDRTVRLTFDHGELEMLTPSFPHESYKGLLGKLIEAICLIRDIPLKSGIGQRKGSASWCSDRMGNTQLSHRVEVFRLST